MTKQAQASITPAAAMSGLVAQALAQGETSKKEAAAKAAPAKKTTPAKKAAQVKTPAKTKPATTVKTVKAAGTASKGAIKFGVYDGAGRPVAGVALASFTFAWLNASGMLKGGSFPKDQATKVAGSTAIGYHKSNKRFAESKDGQLTLTSAGRDFFAERAYDADLAKKFDALLRKGEPDGTYIKKKDAIRAL